MTCPRLYFGWLAAAALSLGWGTLLAQEAQPPAAPAESPKDLPNQGDSGPYRKLAPGVLRSVDPARQLDETVSRHDVVELLAVDPKFTWAKDVPFRHDVWTLELKFKPVRMIWVDIPQPSGRMQRKLIWYMVYCVTNTGQVMHPVEDADLPYKTSEDRKLFEVKTVDRPVRFIPEFILEGRYSLKDGEGPNLVYRDHVIPVAAAAVQMREDRNRRFLTTPEMCREIPVGETLWGVVTWEDIDLKIKRFSVYIQGLTNAYRWKDTPGAYKPKDPIGTGYRRLFRKTLKLNFWRPGDDQFPHEEEIRYGVPGEVDYEWVYR